MERTIKAREVSHRFLQLAGKVQEDHGDPVMLDNLSAFAELPNVSLRTIVDGLADTAYADHSLLAEEFLDQFNRLGAAENLVRRFVEKLEKFEGKIEKESQENAQEALKDFICRYAQSTITLDTWVKQQKRAYPEVNFPALFDDEIQEILSCEIEKTARIIAKNKYHGIFSRNPERFILDFFIKRVLIIKRDKEVGKSEHKINSNALKMLIEFINEEGYPLEKLYMLLYREIITMREMKNTPETIQASTRMALAAAQVLDGSPLFDEELNFDHIFEKGIMPAILDVRLEEVSKKKHLRLVDITDLSPEGLGKVLIPAEAMTPIIEKVESIKTYDDYIRVLRENFNYQKKEDKEGDKIAALDDKEVVKILQEQLKGVREFIKDYMLKRALACRSKNDPIHRDCRFISEIFNCNDLQDLFRWMANPQSFIEEHPRQRGVQYKIIQFQCRRMLEMLLLYRRYAFREDVKKVEENRNILKEQMMNDLQMQVPENRSIQYRIRVKVTKETHQPEGKPKYEVIEDPAALQVNPEKDYTDYEPGEQGEGGTDGTWYRYYPVESKLFSNVEVSIPTEDGKHKKGRVLIYTGDGEPIHCKSLHSYISSILRDKKPTDLLRWMIVTDDKEISDALRNYLYENYSTGNYIVIKDNAEERKITRKKDPKSTDNSEKFKKSRLYSASLYATVPLKNGPEKHDHSHLGFETQIQELHKMLIANSHYTRQSHEQVYTPEREFENTFRYLFPPALYGQRYADYWMQGFDGKQAT